MWHKAIWMGHQVRLELTRVGLLVELARHETERSVVVQLGEVEFCSLVCLISSESFSGHLVKASATEKIWRFWWPTLDFLSHFVVVIFLCWDLIPGFLWCCLVSEKYMQFCYVMRLYLDKVQSLFLSYIQRVRHTNVRYRTLA